MLVDQHRQVTSTIEGDEVKMTIDREFEGHIMDMLTAQYSDEEYAVLREYSTNARDSHIEAGCPERPIEVTLPSENVLENALLKIKDWGVGLSVDDIHNIYSRYGKSTKQQSNDLNGTFGIGCKAGLAYADQFMLVSVKDGIKIQVSISRDDEGTGTMTILDTAATDEPNGVEIVIPSRRENGFAVKADTRLFRWWPEGSVLVNGEAPKRFEGLKLTDDLYLIKEDTSYVVMGNVAYPHDFKLDLNHGYSIVAFVPIGTVNIPPSRDTLRYTPKTEKAVEEIKERIINGLEDALREDVANAPTKAQALATRNKWMNDLYSHNKRMDGFTWRGQPLPEEYPSPVIVTDHDIWGKASAYDEVHHFAVQYWTHALWIKDFNRPAFTATVKKKLIKYAEDNDIELGQPGVRRFVLVRTPMLENAGWIDASMVVPFEDIWAIKLPRKDRSGSGGKYLDPNRPSGSYNMYKDGTNQYGIEASEIDISKPIYYVGHNTNYHYYVKILGDDCTIVRLAENRVAKFQRMFPFAKAARTATRERYNAWIAGLSNREKMALDYRQHTDFKDLASYNPGLIKDPELRRMIRLAQRDVKDLVERRNLFASALGFLLRHQDPLSGKVWENPLDKYPLASWWGASRHKKHLVLYLNAAYVEFFEDRTDG